MIKKIEGWLITFLIKAKVGKYIGGIFSKLTGWKSWITFALIVIIKFCIYSGYIPSQFVDLANEIIVALYGALTVSVGDKFKRYVEAGQKALNETIEKK